MKLLTKEVLNKLPGLYETEEIPLNDKVVAVKFFHPTSNWSWYAIEFDGKDTFWGLVDGFEQEFGYFSLQDLETPAGMLNLPAERDRFFRPTSVWDLIPG